MGEGQSKPGEEGAAHHTGGQADVNMSPAQKAFLESFKSEKRNASFPLFSFVLGGQEYKYMDVRVNYQAPPSEGLLNFEIFFGGELASVDQTLFRNSVAEVLCKYGATLGDGMREAGCMISMIAVPFEISEANAWTLGKAMFDDFGEVQEAKPTEEQETK